MKKDIKFVPGKFYGLTFLLGFGETDQTVGCYIGELNERHLFDVLSIVKVLGPHDKVTSGPHDRATDSLEFIGDDDGTF